MILCCGIELAARLGEFSRCNGKPRNKRKLVFGTVFDNIFVLPIGDVVLILNAYDFDGLARLIDLVRFHLAKTYVANLSLLLQFSYRAQRFFDGNLRVDSMQLPQVDALYFEESET